MVLHDANDVLMEAAKICNYLEWEDASTGIFIIFIVVWAALRLTVFPLMVIRSTLLESRAMLGEVYTLPVYCAFNGLLCFLFLIHCYWFTLILKIAWMKVKTGGVSDVREDD
jgi:ceramide synthetase